MNKYQQFIRQYGYWVLVPFALILVVLILYWVGYWIEHSTLDRAKARMQNTLNFQAATLKASMEKYATLAALVARRPDITSVLSNTNPVTDPPQADQLMNVFSDLSGVSDVWLVDADGFILVSGKSENQSIQDEPYFHTVMKGENGRANITTNSGVHLYIFAIPVTSNNTVIGSIIVRISLDYLEQVWVSLQDPTLQNPILAADENGRVILSNIAFWRHRHFYSSREQQPHTEENIDIVEKFTSQSQDRLKLYGPINGTSGRDYFHVYQDIPLLGWRIHALSDYDTILVQRNMAILITALIIIILIIVTLMRGSHQRHYLKLQRVQQSFALKLEIQVRQRTRAVTLTNQRLTSEIEERRLSEQHLRGRQVELVQAAKLAGINQMSAVLAHEYSQPLAAIRSYAENGAALLLKNDMTSVSDNLQRIRMLVDKMEKIINTLKSFVYRENEYFERIAIETVMDELVILLSPQIKQQQVTLHLKPSDTPLFVMVKKGRLLQMLINLAANAIDAVAGNDVRKVDITWCQKQDKVVIVIRDTGLGIPDDIKVEMFNAFFTTKKPGEGLGLGLTIVANILHDLQGSLIVKEEPGYGGVFEVKIPLAK